MLVNTTVSHISPLLTYLPAVAWYEDTPQADPSLDCGRCAPPRPQWHAGLTSGHRVYGGYRESLGRYRVTLDRNSTEYDGFNGGPDVPGYQLFSAPNLPMGQHHISMFNIGNDPARPMFDFSYLMFESAAGNTTVFDHTSDQCVWLPHTAEAWAVDAVSHTTTQDFGSMGMNFTNLNRVLSPHLGTGVAVYGVLSAQSSSFDVTVDDATGFPLSPHTGNDSPTNETTLLYIKTDLYQGPHTLWVQNNRLSGSATATQLSISSLVVFSDAEASPSSTPPANTR
ncbi:hypothetical protein TRAPUB_1906 [Trametes pubescens]|uniref:Uncharacterized protein n=1 Tax=Trametes pubescens TaxID=154538 RepID=A0A1M2VI14_TRAPU|nr:hypothetical protein TRAPUB_1906 [Trametes pubescens]